MNQRTISKAISISGIGLHTGKTASIELHPAESGTGIVFRRIDLQETPIIPAEISRVISTNRGTTIQEGIAQVWTVEHLMAALTGSGIDNVRID
ncbi:MAG TPA: UDP-3-O-acyl-N-acetylglucosamine deacetylase, partial [Saprospiraceae bacterium]|nr:UDP-3-O-acyl-N-acetylglucosamine deacetylase [Saprospiraceae bacterium]